MPRLILALLWMMIVSFAPAMPGLSPHPAGVAVAQQSVDETATIAEITTRVHEIDRWETRLPDIATNDSKLLEARIAVEQLSKDLIDLSVKFRPVLADISTRLDTLKASVPEGVPQDQAVTDQVKSLTDRRLAINAAIGSAEDGTVKAAKLVEQIGQMRRDIFTNTLSQRVELSTIINAQTATDIASESDDLIRRVTSWFSFMVRFKLNNMLWVTAFALATALAILIAGRKWITPSLLRRDFEGKPGYLTRVFFAFASTLVPAVALALFLGLTFYFFDRFSLLRPDVSEMMRSLFWFIWQSYFIYRLAHSILQPASPDWRLLKITSGNALVLQILISAMGVVTALDSMLGDISSALASPFSITPARSFVAVLLMGILLISISALKPFVDHDGNSIRWPSLARFAIIGSGLVPIIAAALGFVGLARFMTQQIVVTGAIAAAMYVGFLAAQAMSDDHAFRDSVISQRIKRRFSLTDRQIDTLGLVGSLATYAVVLLIGLPLIFLQWGFQVDEILLAAKTFLTDLKIGSVTISLTAIAIGAAVFFLGFLLSRRFEAWLDRAVLARSRMDSGARTSIRTAVGYLGIALSALIGVSVAGVQLSSLAIVAGALSVGIGFGLQNIVSNFVSGLILLAERPFKEGDWIEAGGFTGLVKKVSVRATEIETFQRQSVILPNSDLINQAVGNWTHRNMLSRIDIPVGVGYGSDVVKVQEMLRDIADGDPRILKNPEPFVLFKDFGASSLDFELRFFVGDLFNQMVVQTDLRTEIVRRFREAGIEIPFPQRDINIKVSDLPPEAGAAVSAAVEKAPKAAAGVRKRRPQKGAADDADNS